ncbi:diguanylate cyclase/phosphodiesterase [Caldicellulosiruptor hydrothermalis 108]|uniref:Diguanylate cyclase/phosphodiesterase n=1 Tax=Caldicellulosiruptor hydrothermalis (strain DSM 18901 / VKM B-2411 / 108) TaxID=632292 RepID=E4Q9U0_CALH1|nr:GGDEF domain-containing phosphodiesterase [Caldicellulosiruptor hydrothermalis]ADQ08195.1 diguanylate cyclase/phosphodiesterase [Caldicellulosiruptor hydrothermalis 108]
MFSKFYLSKCFNKGFKAALAFFILNIAYLAGVIYLVFFREPLFEKYKLIVAIFTTAVVIADSLYLFYVLYKLLQEKYKLKMFLHKTAAESDVLKRKLFEITKKEYKKFPNGKKTKIVEIAYFDMITGLPNKLQLEIFFDKLRKDVPSHFNEIAVVVVDIENLSEFEMVNFYSLSNVILKDIGYKLKNGLPEKSFVAKIEENKFAILFYDYGCRDLLLQYIKVIEEIIDGRWYLVGEELELKSIVGVAFYPNDGNSIHEVLKSATKALEQARIRDDKKVHFTSEEENSKFSFCISVSKELKKAVLKKNFLLVYQPLVDLKKHKVAGAEVFLRWINPQKGIISAKEFISIAQKEGMIPEIEEWVLDTVAQDMEDFEKTCTEDFFISLNVSFLDSYVVERIFSNKVFTYCDKYNDMMVFEISQQDIDANLSECLKVAEEVKQKGFRIIVDDWCSDNIAIDTIRYFPVDAVKVDNKCIESAVFDKSIGTIVKGVVDIAHALKIKVIAEGVETPFHYKIAKDLGCDLAQGFLFSKPLFRSEFLEFYRRHENQLMVL